MRARSPLPLVLLAVAPLWAAADAAGAVQAAPEVAPKDGGLTLVVPDFAAMLPGQDGWVSALWTATKDVCDVKVTGSGPGLRIGYPANTDTYSSFYINSALATGNTDYTAFNVAVPDTATASVTVTLNVSYLQMPPGLIKKSDDLKTKKFGCKGPKGAQTVTITLPVRKPTGAAVLQKTAAVTVPRATPTWVKVAFEGTRSGVSSFRAVLDPPEGLGVIYPGEKASAGLNESPTLGVGRSDYVSFRLDASGMEPGIYQVPLKATYTGGSFAGELSVTVT